MVPQTLTIGEPRRRTLWQENFLVRDASPPAKIASLIAALVVQSNAGTVRRTAYRRSTLATADDLYGKVVGRHALDFLLVYSVRPVAASPMFAKRMYKCAVTCLIVRAIILLLSGDLGVFATHLCLSDD
jgi:hypothetical protein